MTAEHLERQLRAVLAALQDEATLGERAAQLAHAAVLAQPVNLALLLGLIDAARVGAPDQQLYTDDDNGTAPEPHPVIEVVALPSYGTLPWETVRAYVEAATGSAPIIDPEYFIGHQVVGINYNSLNRIMSALVAGVPK